MESEFIAILQKLVAEQGRESLLNAAKCKAFLSDYTRNEYKKESRLLLQTLDVGVQKAIDKVDNITICKKQQIRQLHEEYGIDEKVATDVVDTLALVLRGDDPKSNVEALIEKGIEYYNNNDHDNANKQFDVAINLLNTIIRLDPNNVRAYANRGEAYRMKGQYDAAISNYNEYIRLDPNNAFAYANRGDAYYLKGQYDAAISDFNEAIRLDPNYAWAYGNRGRVYRQKGQKNQAIQDFEKALSLDTDFEWVRQELIGELELSDLPEPRVEIPDELLPEPMLPLSKTKTNRQSKPKSKSPTRAVQPYTPPAITKHAKIMVLISKATTIIKQRLFWPVFISIVLGGIIGGLFSVFFLRDNDLSSSLAEISINIAMKINGKYAAAIGLTILYIITTLPGVIGGIIGSVSCEIDNGIKWIIIAILGGVGKGWAGGILIGGGFTWILSKIPHSLLLNTSSMVSITIYVSIGSLMGLTGFICGFMRWN